jgi:hypothetical protein
MIKIMDEREVVICSCNSIEHQIVFNYLIGDGGEFDEL